MKGKVVFLETLIYYIHVPYKEVKTNKFYVKFNVFSN